MKRRSFLKMTSAAGLITLITPTGIIHALRRNASSGLQESFINPPESSKAYTWWHWMNGNVTKEGITLDLESMKRVGIGGFQNFDVGQDIPKGPVVYGSPQYWELKKHAIKEASRLGLNFEIHNCPGWSSSGGPWITPELSMQMVTWSEVDVEGGEEISTRLPEPPSHNNYYNDVIVIAFPASNNARIVDWPDKANFPRRGRLFGEDAQTPQKRTGLPIDPNSVLDITKSMDRNGGLNWQAPAGKWTILRFGSTTTGAGNVAAPEGGVGLECDKLSKEALEFHLNKILENLLSTLVPLATKRKVGLLIDSYEVGKQNWTPAFPQEFQKRCGYSLVGYLPAMTGRVVGSVDTSDRFLWDVRRTQADLMADNYYGYFTELCHKHGINAYAEPYDPGNFEELQVGSRVDRVMGEFWIGEKINHSVRLVASVGHVFGKKVIGAESFTGEPINAKWQEYPFLMKSHGDWMYTQGVNRFIFHRFAHQPHPTALPGMTMGQWGFHFDRTNTWFEQSKKWLDYLACCQALLQQGLFVADLLYFVGQDAGISRLVLSKDLNPAPPEGYGWDFANAEAILNRLAIQNGCMVLPDGMSYRILVIHAKATMTREVLGRIRDLVNQGMVLVGTRPEYSPSLSDQKSEAEFIQIAKEIWGDLNERSPSERIFGKGRVFWSQPLQNVLNKLVVRPDFEFTSRSGDAPINYIHRTIGGNEVYFVANRRRRSEDVVVTFRVQDKRPELWDPDTREIKPVDVYELVDERVRMPIQFDPAGSAFVVFRSPIQARRLQRIEKDRMTILSSKPFSTPCVGMYRNVNNNFSISVWAKPEIDVSISSDMSKSLANLASFLIYPPSGEKHYGPGHATCGLTAGRNGVLVFERSDSDLVSILIAELPLAGWTHLTMIYQEGVPFLYINGRLAQHGKASGKIIHPGLGEAHQSDGAYYYIGHMTDPQLFERLLSEVDIQGLVAKGPPTPDQPRPVEIAGNNQFLIWQDGHYTFRDGKGENSSVEISGLGKPIRLNDIWKVSFPPNLGAPAQITLPELISLHRHPEDGIKYFSGIVTYRKTINVPAAALAKGKHLFLDLGRVEVIAQVRVNGKNLGILWKPPYRVNITDAVKIDENDLEIEVTNLWPNRLIGDEHLPRENEYYSGRGGRESFPAGIKKLPDWYLEGKPRPTAGRIAFTTWKHFDKDSPLLESGLVGPVMLRTAVMLRIKS
jgi:hypothetical protein